ncbi:hypothetical protein BDV36DRAFT_224746 [Aspergillus pseudocaelatus]|uniref:Uncharacterized protein n=1 Tax=Aspergillus pseudocaelatus TaxID=1825620 RepID=A0ABQ6WE80_9EURO|nr:hypothetical protein BDV36DRAFT_224746 [Aspergillus pseudocaelatus]
MYMYTACNAEWGVCVCVCVMQVHVSLSASIMLTTAKQKLRKHVDHKGWKDSTCHWHYYP